MPCRLSNANSGSGCAVARACGAATHGALQARHSMARTIPRRISLLPPSTSSLHALRRVFLGYLVVEERGRVRRGHEAPIDLRVDPAVLEHLAVRHLDLERARCLVVADRAQL